MSQAMEAKDLDLTSPVFKANPYPTFAHLRLTDPVHLLSSDQKRKTWLLTRYQEAEMVLRDERFVKRFSDTTSSATPANKQDESSSSALDLVTLGMGKFDPPNHTRLRSLVSLSFTPRLVEQWRDRIQGMTDRLIDTVVEKGHMDLVEEIAFPLPLTVIAEMLGVPREDMPALHRWIRLIVEALGNPVALQQVHEELQACHRYLLNLIASKRQQPTSDLISSLIRAETEGDRLSERELVAMIFLLTMAGYETTGTLISNGILALLTHPEQMVLLRRDPTLIKTAVEEFLRYRSPLMLATMRWAREEIELCGKKIYPGDQVVVSLAAANYDEKVFVSPDSLDITRQENHHLAFSKGIHYCLGASLARLEGQIAINTLLRRLPRLRLQCDPSDLTWRPGSMVLGLAHLPVAF
jgi:cytochrome P450